VRAASGALRGWHELPRATLYVTLEPCAMCAGALLQARVGALVWGAPNPLLGADGSWVSLLGAQPGGEAAPPARPHAFNPRLAVRRGVLADECGALMRDFFRARRSQQAAAHAQAPGDAAADAAAPLS
jgi:tRNA(adenine34) deaminase